MMDLTAYDRPRDDAGSGLGLVRTQEFYRQHAEEILARMRRPTLHTDNPAAVIVAQCETNTRLRAEAERAIEAAREAREAVRALDTAIAAYNPRSRV